MRSLLTTLSPTEVWSNCWVTIVLFPFLVWTPVSIVSCNCSLITVVVWVSISAAGPPEPPLIQPPTPNLAPVEFSVISLPCPASITFLPVQFVCQESHKIGPNPVWGSTFCVLARLSKVFA